MNSLPCSAASCCRPVEMCLLAPIDADSRCIRICYRTLLLIGCLCLAPYLELWFTKAGPIPLAAARDFRPRCLDSLFVAAEFRLRTDNLAFHGHAGPRSCV